MNRLLFKRSIKKLFLVLVLPLFISFRLLVLTGREDGVFQGYSQALSLVPGKLGVYLRAAFYRMVCPGTSDEITVGFLTVFSHRDTTIRKGAYIGPQSNIGKCEIGENALLGSGVHILSGSRQHGFSNPDKPIKDQGGTYTKIRIGADCWLGNGALVMTSVPDHCIVAAGTVVSKEPRPGDIVAGNPGTTVRNRLSRDSDGPKDA